MHHFGACVHTDSERSDDSVTWFDTSFASISQYVATFFDIRPSDFLVTNIGTCIFTIYVYVVAMPTSNSRAICVWCSRHSHAILCHEIAVKNYLHYIGA